MQQKQQNFIQTQFNIGERYLSKYSYRVDGWRGNQNPDGNLKEMHPIRKIPFAQIRKMTKEKKQALTAEEF